VHYDNNAIVVTRHIEHNIGRNIVGCVKKLFDVFEIPKVGLLYDCVPLAQNRFRCWMSLPEVPKHLD
jgi:hypothetical protein